MIYSFAKGTYTKPKTQAKDRLCPHCKTGVEDELHLVLICPRYDEKHHNLLNVIETHDEAIITEDV